MKLLPRQSSTRFSLPIKNIENNPMQSSGPGRWRAMPATPFDTSGKSAALI
jgi:hypothetical protein